MEWPGDREFNNDVIRARYGFERIANLPTPTKDQVAEALYKISLLGRKLEQDRKRHQAQVQKSKETK